MFHYLLPLWAKSPETYLLETVRFGLNQIIKWGRIVNSDTLPAHNIVLTDGNQMVGSCFGRSLWFLDRRSVCHCAICGKSHVHHEAGARYRSVEIASEPLTAEADWKGVPEGSVFAVDPDYHLRFATLQ